MLLTTTFMLIATHRIASCCFGAGHTECAEVLLEAGSAVDAVTTSGSTALHSAASNGHAPVVQRLITAGADVDVQVCYLLPLATLLA